MRRTQLYLDEDQYRWLKSQAGRKGSIAGTVRKLIDAARDRGAPDLRSDPFLHYLIEEPPAEGGQTTSVRSIDRDLYGT